MKDLSYYLGLPYTVVIRRDDEGDFVARIDELPGCSAHGGSKEEAIENLDEAQRLWVEEALENKEAIPEPEADAELPSGKWVQRVPRTLHRKLSRLASRERVSLNQLVTSILAEAVGIRKSYRSHEMAAVDAHAFADVEFGSLIANEVAEMWTIHDAAKAYSVNDLSNALRLMNGWSLPNEWHGSVEKVWNLEGTANAEEKERKHHSVDSR